VGSYRGAAALRVDLQDDHARHELAVPGRINKSRVVRNTAVVHELIVERVRASDGRITAKRLVARPEQRAPRYAAFTHWGPGRRGR
jgi:hypothetical protein